MTGKVVVLCGSMRFIATFDAQERRLVERGDTPISVCKAYNETQGLIDEQKMALDALHKRKILLADEVLVIDTVPDGPLAACYIGSSTRSEIHFAMANSIPVRYLSEESE